MGCMKIFGKKKDICSRFHSRFGDASITAPTGGSWNQGLSSDTNALSQLDISSSTNGHERPRNRSELKKKPTSSLLAMLCSRDPAFQESSSDLTAARPRDEPRDKQNQSQKALGPEYDGRGSHGSRISHRGRGDDNISRASRPVTPAGHFRDDIPPSRNRSSSRNSAITEGNINVDGEVIETADEQHLRRPPLSITSRMRSPTSPSASTEHNIPSRQTTLSSAMAPSSHRTSPAMSSTSTASVYPQSPNLMKIAYNPSFNTKRSRREKRETNAAKELVPSYDELYG
ncbi:hypothetical protein NFIA_107780 [Paecilomyces variotii No. 5]|uniref:Uncharacterized protein n=1 Tax=Byssochlamys spectabilis (strain No. 5 / NBRC 109023) TaxID=1356009 RepID=V5HV06_BYSSN|nr:hypothetical protein NFIA_107780 [Paecilomyces variotii No. 5]